MRFLIFALVAPIVYALLKLIGGNPLESSISIVYIGIFFILFSLEGLHLKLDKLNIIDRKEK